MRIAAVIFGIAGTAYLGCDVWLTMTYGVRVGTWLMALFALGLLFQGYGLLRAKKGARLGGLISAIIIAGAAAIIASLFAFPDFPNSFYTFGLMEIWPMLGALMAVAVAFTVAAALIATSKRAP
jgi:hypothetical protein